MKTSLMTAKRSFAAILLCLAAVFAGCKGGEDVPKPDPKDGTVSVTGTAVVGQTLTANSVQADFPFTGDFTWESSASGAAAATDWTPISGATGENKNQLTLTDSLKDKYVRATRTNSNNKKVSSDAKQVNGGGSDEATVTVSGTYKVGSKLTASSDPGKTGETFVNDFIWEYAYNADGSYYSITGTGVTGEYGSELTIDADLDGKYIRAKRTLSSGPLFYSDSKKVGGGDEPKVTVTGETKVGAILTATSTGDGFSGGFIWELADSKTATSGTPISGASGSTLTIYASLATKYVRAKKENSNLASSYAASEWMGPIAAADTQAGGDDATARTAENLMRSLEDAGMNVVE